MTVACSAVLGVVAVFVAAAAFGISAALAFVAVHEALATRRFRREFNPLGLPPQGYLCPSCITYHPEGLTDAGVCQDCKETVTDG